MKRFVAFIFLIIIVIGGIVGYRLLKPPVSDINGNQLRYSLDEINKRELTGIFVHNEDDTFSPCIMEMPNYQGETGEASPDRYVWYTEKDEEVSKLIPMVTGGGELVAIFNKDEELAATHYLEKYRFKGYTIGAHIYMEDDKTLYLTAKDTLSGSQANGAIMSMSNNTGDIYEIAEISGSDVLPINNIDPNMQLLLGLQKDKLYDIKYYHGTKEDYVTFQADTKVFQSQQWIPLATPYKKTNKGYFVINLPEDLPDGYYYISDMGFFALKR